MMKPIRIPAKTAEEASAVYCAMRDMFRGNASSFPPGVWNGHHISYNGRVWEAGKPEGERKAIFNPGGDRATPDVWIASTLHPAPA